MPMDVYVHACTHVHMHAYTHVHKHVRHLVHEDIAEQDQKERQYYAYKNVCGHVYRFIAIHIDMLDMCIRTCTDVHWECATQRWKALGKIVQNSTGGPYRPRWTPRWQCQNRADWEPAAATGRRTGGVLGVFWRCPAVL